MYVTYCTCTLIGSAFSTSLCNSLIPTTNVETFSVIVICNYSLNLIYHNPDPQLFRLVIHLSVVNVSLLKVQKKHFALGPSPKIWANPHWEIRSRGLAHLVTYPMYQSLNLKRHNSVSTLNKFYPAWI